VELARPCPFVSGKTWRDVIAELPDDERPMSSWRLTATATSMNSSARKRPEKPPAPLILHAGETRGDLSPAEVQQRKQIKRPARSTSAPPARLICHDAVIEKQGKARDNKALSRYSSSWRCTRPTSTPAAGE